MFVKFALSAFLASTSLLVRADVTPSDPGPGVVYNVGGTCHITWTGDATSTTAWKDMSIELMTGDNLEMVHLTTVATNLDGTVAGTFDHICPGVTPNAAIYFYQFTAPAATDKQWTTRFTIASSTGATTDPTNATQPDGSAVPWGTGALTDPTTAVAAPSYLSGSAAAAASSTSSALVTAPSASTSTSTPAVGSTTTGASTSTTSGFTTSTASSNTTTSPSSAANSTSANSTQGNGAGSVVADSRLLQAAVALGASTMAFALLM
ncbi:hypothetical protein C0991_000572 [Blastosporella zonata]|nr:hypothetical protein C0991_000572 [Blastosporella zonata]